MQKCFEIGKERKASSPLDAPTLSKVFSGCGFCLVNVLFVGEVLEMQKCFEIGNEIKAIV